MPKHWHDRHAVNKIEDDEERNFNRSIVADRKPYFMRYIYPQLMKDYNTYIKNTNKNSLRNFGITSKELLSLDESLLTKEQSDFILYYHKRMPVGTGDCVMNRICRKIEDRFDGVMKRSKEDLNFDFSFMKNDCSYSEGRYFSIKKLYDEFNTNVSEYMMFAKHERISKSDSTNSIYAMNNEFEKRCAVVCPNEYELSNILLDICYKKQSTKKFLWNMCGSTIIDTLLENNGNKISFPVLDDEGDIEYRGLRYSLHTVEIKEEETDERDV